jgi:hypothetical protein
MDMIQPSCYVLPRRATPREVPYQVHFYVWWSVYV